MILSMAWELAQAVALQATVVLALAWGVTLLLSRRSAAARQAVWSSALAILIAIPVLSLILPAWDPGPISSLFGPAPSVSPASEDASREMSRDAGAAGTARGIQPPAEAARDGRRGIPAHAEPASGRSTITPLPPSSPRPSILGTLATITVGVWIAGAVVLLLRLLVHAVRAHNIIRRIPEANDPELEPIARPLFRKLRIQRWVKVVTDDGVSLPFSWGVINPSVVLPSAAHLWPEEKQRSVLAHELAHVARGDHLMHLLVEIVRAFYWPNPLVWFAARRNSVERERSCDDLALGSGTPSQEYASHLVDLARMQLEAAPAGAVMMAREPGFFERIRCVMSRKVDRSPRRPGFQPLTLVMALFVAAPLAALGPADTFRDTPRTIPTTSELIAELRDAGDPLARQRAAWWLGEHEDRTAVRALMESLGDEAPEVRLAAAWALGEIKDRDSIPALVKNLDDDDFLAREAAVLALGEIEHPSALPALQSTFDRDQDLRKAVIWAYGEIRGSEAEFLREEAFATIGQRPWRNEQVWAGTLRKHPPATGDLSDALSRLLDSDAETRRLAALTIGHLGIKDRFDSLGEVVEAVDALLAALSDPAPEVRAAAVWSLDEINPSRSKRFHH